MKKIFVAWQDPISRAWFPIGQLTYNGKSYQFVYIFGVKEAQEKAGFEGLWSFRDFTKVYDSTELFAFFGNRVLRSSRPDYPQFISWLNLESNEDNIMDLMARSGGKKVTDNFEIFPNPELDENKFYHIYFLAHGLRYIMPQELTHDRILSLQQKERLYLLHDSKNDYDPYALMLRTEDDYHLGYLPRYLSDNLLKIVQNSPNLVEVTVEKINPPPAPLQMRLLCHLKIKNDNFRPFSSEKYQPIPQPIALKSNP